MKIYGAFYLILFSFVCQAQDTYPMQRKEIRETFQAAKKSRSTAPLEDLLSSGRFKEGIAIADIHMKLARLETQINKSALKKGAADAAQASILDHYEKAIQNCSSCSNFARLGRYQFLERYSPGNAQKEQDLKILLNEGYRKEKDGRGLSVEVAHGKDNWVGLGWSAAAKTQFPFKMKYTEYGTKKFKKQGVPGIGVSALDLFYRRNLNHSQNEFSISLFTLHSPIGVNFTRVGFQSGAEGSDLPVGKRWFYRPEFSLGAGGLSLSYAYNVMFHKRARSNAETHLIQLRYLFVKKKRSTT